MDKFKRLCKDAFTARRWKKVPLLHQATAMRHGGKYKTRPLKNALKDAFGGLQLYGGTQTSRDVYDTKVAVTSTSGSGSRPLVLANYSRQEWIEPAYKFEFPQMLQTWEAAMATSAAPSYFKPFVSKEHRLYLDGGLYYNNPVKVANSERRMLWPDVAHAPPDIIILSVGTGKTGREVEEGLDDEPIEKYGNRLARTVANSRMRMKDVAKYAAVQFKPAEVVNNYFQILVSYYIYASKTCGSSLTMQGQSYRRDP